jgi:glycosyltransferase involved in cell wall biosynthesis
MHILLIHQAFAALDNPGGTRHHELARHLTTLGHQVTVIASPVSYLTGTTKTRLRWADRQVDDCGVTIIRAWTLPALHRSFVWRVFSFLSFMFSSFWIGISVHQVDLVWGTTPPIFQGVTAWLLAKLKHVPFLFEVRDLWPAFAIAVGVLKNRTLIHLSEWLERFLYKHADHLVVNSPGFVDHVKARGAKAVTLIPNGADPQMFDPSLSGDAFRSSHRLDGQFVVLYAGAHGMSNDLSIVLDAADLLRDEAGLTFVLLGDGKEKPALVAQAQARRLENVHFLPPLPKSEIPQALAAADACLAILKPIELYKTTYPNKVFDYMAAGKPVLLAIDGVIRTLVERAQAGIFVTPGDPQALVRGVRQLMANPHAASQMGQSGRIYIEQNYSRAKIAEQFNSLLLSLRRTYV